MSVTTGTFPGVRIVDMPDLGAITDNSSFVGEHAGSGRFSAGALRSYIGPEVDIRTFGARGDGVTDNTSAFAAAQAFVASSARPVGLVFPAGVYLYSVSPNWAIPFASYRACGDVRLRYTGTGNAWIFDGGPGPSSGVYGTRALGNFIVEAPATAADGVYIRACHHSRFEFRVKGCGSTSAALHMIFGVCSEVRIISSANEGGWYSGAKPKYGILMEDRGSGGNYEPPSYCVLQMPIVEAADIGIALISAYGNLFLGGTSEGETSRGLQLSAAANNNKFVGMDFEVNTIQDIYCQGNYNTFLECDSVGQITLDSPGTGNTVRGGECNQISVAAGAVSTTISGVRFNRSGTGALIDNGTRTRWRDNLDVTAGIVQNAPRITNTITVGASPFTYTNTTGNDMTVQVTGGTVSGIGFVRGPTTATGDTHGSYYLSPADGLTVTYTVAPTMFSHLR